MKRRTGRLGAVLGMLWVCAAAGATDKRPKAPEGKTIPATDPVVEVDRATHKSDKERQRDAVKYHIKNLADKDPEVRQTAAQILGNLNAVDAVPFLIEALRDDHVLVQIAAHGALNRITGKNFGYKAYAEWKRWWDGNKDELLRNREKAGVTKLAEVRAPASNTQGLLFLETGDYGQAYRMFLDAVNADPRVPDYRNNLGLAVMEQGRDNPLRYINAINYFEEALGLDDSLPQPYMNIGSCYARMGKHIEAQHWFRIAIAKDKKGMLWEHCWVLGKDLLQRGDFHLALEYLEEARVKGEKNRKYDPRVYRDLALAYYGLDMYHSAYKEIMNLRTLGHEPHPDFVAKVRKALIDQGVDPDKEDEAARKEAKIEYGRPSPNALPDTPPEESKGVPAEAQEPK